MYDFQVMDALTAINRWLLGEYALSRVAQAFGFDPASFSTFLATNGIADYHGDPCEGVTQQHVINCICIYLIMKLMGKSQSTKA